MGVGNREYGAEEPELKIRGSTTGVPDRTANLVMLADDPKRADDPRSADDPKPAE